MGIEYYCNASELAVAFANKDYSDIRRNIRNSNILITDYIEEQGKIVGYHVHDNVPLTSLYEFPIYMIDFVLSGVDSESSKHQLDMLDRLFSKICERVTSEPGYYIFRLPTQVMDLLKVFNKAVPDSVMCGGLITYMHNGESREIETNNNVKVIRPDESYISKNRQALIGIAETSFKNYKGQYHISNILDYKAQDIYTKWLETAFTDRSKDNTIIVTELNYKPMGFWIYTEDEYCGHAELGGVNAEARGNGLYTHLLLEGQKIAKGNGKFLILGTQFDNFAVQSIVPQFGMRPYLTYYTMHLDSR